jgi:acetyltransferase-like isoleucine patch superfamily enzyme
MPGAVLEDGSGTGSCAIVGHREVVRPGRLAIGDHPLPLHVSWRPRYRDACAGHDALWDVCSTLVLLVNNLIIALLRIVPFYLTLLWACGYLRGSRWAPPAFARGAAEAAEGEHGLLKVLLSAAGLAARSLGFAAVIVLANAAVSQPLSTGYHVFVKRAILGTLAAGRTYPLRGSLHLRWMVALVAARASAVPMAYRFLFEYSNGYLRWMGATVGDAFRLFPHPSFSASGSSESDLVTYGDDVTLGATLYAHDFSNMHLEFKDVRVGDGCRVFGARTQVLPGTVLPARTTIVNNGYNLVFPGIVDEPGKFWMGNPVRAVDERDVRADVDDPVHEDEDGYIRL